MDNYTRSIAEAAARLLLHHYRETHPQWDDDRTPLDALAAWLGLHIETFHPDDYPKGTYGFMDPDEGENLIWLCRDLGESFRRFTLAHEIGHAILHCHSNERIQGLLGNLTDLILTQESLYSLPELSREDPCHDSDVQENMPGHNHHQDGLDSEVYDPRSQRELAANIFAAELLMPLDRIRALYLQEDAAPHTLAAIFAVSHTAMLNRLAGLLKAPFGTISPTHTDAPKEKTAPLPQRPTPKKQYDEFQQAAIEASTPALIVAGPGSGKTSTLIGRTEYLVRTLGIPPQRILALTFSRKAAEEMEERLQGLLNQNTYILPKVSTFHAFCADVLRQHGALVGLRTHFTLLDEAEGYFLLRQQANAIRLRHYLKLHSPAYYFPDILKAISRAKDELITPEDYARLAEQMKVNARNEEALQEAEKAAEVAHIYALYEEGLARRGDTDFGGLLMLTVQLFRQHPEILHEQQQLYQHILVDEFQDVNRASGVLLRELAGTTGNVWVVGDANQAIYGFRGASPANISQFEHDFPGAAVLPLSRNYRSRPDLVTIAEAFRCRQLELGEEPGKNQPVRLTLPDTYVILAKASNDHSELMGLIEDIQYRKRNGYSYKDMVVLCRTRAHAQKITRALAEAGLPVIERGGVLEQEHIKDVLSILLLLVDGSGMGLLRAARQPVHPLGQDDIEALLLAARTQKVSPRMLIFSGETPLSISIEGQRSLRRLSEIMQALQYTSDTWSLLAHYLLLETTLVRDLLIDQENKLHAAILADYDRLLQMARHFDQQQQQRNIFHTPGTGEVEEVITPLTLEERIKGFLEYLSLLVLLRQDGNSRESAQEESEENADIIRVMTVHASKGLEFPVVYMPGLVQRRFPLQARSSPVNAPEGMLPAESTGHAAHESGESCLFYVGVTRARDVLVLSYSERYGKQKYKRSPYLDALEAGLPEDRFTKLHWETKDVPEATTITQPTSTSQPGKQFVEAMKPEKLSVSAIEAYQRCPRQYVYSNIYRFSAEEDTYRLFRQATQRTVETLRKQLQEVGENSQPSRIPTAQEIRELYSQHWQAVGGHTAPFATLYEQHGHEIVEGIRHKLLAQEEIWETSSDYHVDIAGTTIQVTVDRVENSAAPIQRSRFVRTRFGKRKEKPAPEMREFFYTLAYRQHHPGQDVELHSHNLSTGEVVPIKMTTKKEQSLYDEVERSIQGLERNEFPAQPASVFQCPTCPFFFICPA
jgi:DNA helicase-2/ATP-dependent DNA helicase PcrA